MRLLSQLHGDPLPIVQQMIHQMIHQNNDSPKLAPLHWKRETRALLNERLPGHWIGRESERDDGDISFIVRNDDATARATTTTVANTAFDDGDVSFIVRYDDATATATRTTTTVANTAFDDGDVSFIVRYGGATDMVAMCSYNNHC